MSTRAAPPTAVLSGASRWDIVRRQFRRNATAVWGLRATQLLVLLAIYAPLLASSHPLLWSVPGEGLSSPWAERLFDEVAWEHGIDRFFNSLMVTLTLAFVLRGILWLVLLGSAGPRRVAGAAWRWYLAGAFVLALVQAGGFAFTRSLPAVDYRQEDPRLLRQAAARAQAWALAHVTDDAARATARAAAPEALAGLADGPAAQALQRQAQALREGLSAASSREGLDAAAEEAQRRRREGAIALERGARSLERADKLVPSGAPERWALRTPIPYGYREQLEGREESFAPALDLRHGARHLLGTDEVGRDVLARILYGTRISLTIGIVAVAIYVAIGTILGALAGYLGGRTDLLIMRLVEILICIPTLFLLMTIVALFESRSIFLIMGAIGVIGWTGVCRLVRGQVLRERGLDYVVAAKALGYTTRRIVFRHVLPNALAPVLVAATFGVASAILTESTLSFIGLGDIAVPSWGRILDDGRQHGYWHLILPPSVAIFITVLALNLVGDGMRDALDPKLRN